MRWRYIILGLALFGFVISSCAPSGPSTLEIMDSLKTKVNEKDLEGTMALFAEDAVYEESYIHITYYGTEEIEDMWIKYFRKTPFIAEFRDISVDGDTATYTWVEVGTSYTNFWPTIIEVQDGKITYMDFYEDKEQLLTGEE